MVIRDISLGTSLGYLRLGHKLKIKAHIPTQQYGFIEISGAPEEKSEIERLYNEYAESPISFKKGIYRRLKAFVGGEIDYDELNHVYSWNGQVYQSGSQYAAQFEHPFDIEAIANKMATKYKSNAEDIAKMWELKAETSRGFGTAMHGALELYGKYNGLATALERTTATHDHPVINEAVQSFYAGRADEKAEYEVLVIDHKNKRAGRVDRLLITGTKSCRVQDYKFNAVMTSAKLKVYWKQLEFYSGILKEAGWAVEPPQIFHYNGSWKTYESKEIK